MRPFPLRKKTSLAIVKNSSTNPGGRWWTCLRWLALAGLIAMQTWLAFSSVARAGSGDTYTWTGATSSDWSDSTNWSGGNVPIGNIGGAAIVFDATGSRTWATCTSDVSGINSLSISASNYTIYGTSTLTCNSSATITCSLNGFSYIYNNIVATGNLTVNSSTPYMHFGDATPALAAITLQNNAVLTLNIASGTWISLQNYAITGAGSLVKTGAGDLYLTATCDYTGATTISQGKLIIGCDNALPVGTDLTIESPGTLELSSADPYRQTIASLSGSGDVQLNTNTLTISGSNDCSFSGNIGLDESTRGTLVKTGTSTMTLLAAGVIRYTDVSVNGGTLEVDGAADNSVNVTVGQDTTLGLTGTVTGIGLIYNLVNNAGGTISPGNDSSRYGTLHVTGNFTNNTGSAVEVYITAASGGQTSKIAVTGTADIEGGTLHIHGASGSGFVAGQTYKFLTCGSLSGGGFNDVNWDGLPAGMTATVHSSDDTYTDLTIYLLASNYRGRGATYNQQAVGGYLDQHASGASGDFETVLTTIDGLTDAHAQAAYDAMSGELYGSLSTIGLEEAEGFLQRLSNRLRQQSMTRGMQFETAQAKWDDSLLLVSRHEAWLREKITGWTTWAEGFGVGARVAGNGNASGLGYSTGGLSLGMEKWLEEDLLVGVAGGYSNSYTTLDQRSDRGTIDAGHLAVYVQREFDNRYFTGMAAYGYNAYDSLRHVTIGNDLRTAEASYGGNSFSFYTEVGRNLRGHFVHLQPYAALEYIQLHQNGFTESGANSVDLSVGGVGADAFRGLLGTRVLSYLRTDAGRLVTLEGRAAWRHEFLDDNRVLDATFAGQSGTAYAIQGINVDRDAAILGTGLTYDYTKSLKFGLNYDLLFSANYTAHAGSGNVSLAW